MDIVEWFESLRISSRGADTAFIERFLAAVDVVRSALHVHKPQELCFSFNGGKDCTAVLHVLRYVLYKDSGVDSLAGIQVVHFQTNDNHPEVVSFQKDVSDRVGFVLRELPGQRAGLEVLVSEGVRGVIMGTRSTDPAGSYLSGPFTPTSMSWPPCMRICPVLQWTYADVWQFLRGASLPVCCLYERGFTSVGAAHNSHPNPALLVPERDSAKDPTYLPAWLLTDVTLERAGRSMHPHAAVTTIGPTASTASAFTAAAVAAAASAAASTAAAADTTTSEKNECSSGDPGELDLAHVLASTGALPLQAPSLDGLGAELEGDERATHRVVRRSDALASLLAVVCSASPALRAAELTSSSGTGEEKDEDESGDHDCTDPLLVLVREPLRIP
jgi:FAD synthetase